MRWCGSRVRREGERKMSNISKVNNVSNMMQAIEIQSRRQRGQKMKWVDRRKARQGVLSDGYHMHRHISGIAKHRRRERDGETRQDSHDLRACNFRTDCVCAYGHDAMLWIDDPSSISLEAPTQRTEIVC